MSNIQVAGTREILSTMLSDHVGDDASAIKADTVGYISDNTGVDLAGYDVNLVQNDAGTMNVALPYYSGLESQVSAIDEEELLGVTGGTYHPIGVMYGAYRAANDYLQSVGITNPQDPVFQYFQEKQSQAQQLLGDSHVPESGK